MLLNKQNRPNCHGYTKIKDFCHSKDYGNLFTCSEPLICVRCVYNVCWCCMQVCMKCAQIYIFIYIIYNANTSKFKYIRILEFLLQLGLSLVWDCIPSQTHERDEEAAFLARQRIGYLHRYRNITMDPCNTIHSCHSHSSIEDIVIQNVIGYISILPLYKTPPPPLHYHC